MKRRSRKHRKRTSMTLISEILMTPEQREKFSLSEESVDIKGYIKKLKVSDQTIFDVLFIEFMIEQPHHEAAVLFMEDVSKSGIYVSSPSLDSDGSHQPARKAANHMAERRMCFSSPYRWVVNDCGERRASVLMKFIDSAHTFPRTKPEKKEFAEVAAKLLLPCLESLSHFYKTNMFRDPRRVIGSQGK